MQIFIEFTGTYYEIYTLDTYLSLFWLFATDALNTDALDDDDCVSLSARVANTNLTSTPRKPLMLNVTGLKQRKKIRKYI